MTDALQHFFGVSGKVALVMKQKSPTFQCSGEAGPTMFARRCTLLASHAGAYATGVILPLDGGAMLTTG